MWPNPLKCTFFPSFKLFRINKDTCDKLDDQGGKLRGPSIKIYVTDLNFSLAFYRFINSISSYRKSDKLSLVRICYS